MPKGGMMKTVDATTTLKNADACYYALKILPYPFITNRLKQRNLLH